VRGKDRYRRVHACTDVNLNVPYAPTQLPCTHMLGSAAPPVAIRGHARVISMLSPKHPSIALATQRGAADADVPNITVDDGGAVHPADYTLGASPSHATSWRPAFAPPLRRRQVICPALKRASTPRTASRQRCGKTATHRRMSAARSRSPPPRPPCGHRTTCASRQAARRPMPR